MPLEGPFSQVPENTRVECSWLLISKSGTSGNPRIPYRISFTVWFLFHNKHLGNQSLKQWRGEHRDESDYHILDFVILLDIGHFGFFFCCFWFLNWLCVGKLILEAFLINFLRGKNRLKWLIAQIFQSWKPVSGSTAGGLVGSGDTGSVCVPPAFPHQAQQMFFCPCKPSFP